MIRPSHRSTLSRLTGAPLRHALAALLLVTSAPVTCALTLTCEPDIVATPERGRCDADVTIVPPQASGPGSDPGISGVRSDTRPLTDPYPLGDTTITWTGQNSEGIDTCTQKVSVGTRLALRASVYAWGANANGQLGRGTFGGPTNGSIATPGLVTGLPLDIVSLAAGSLHSLALTSDGKVYAWGNNNWGQLGNGTFTTTGTQGLASPAQVSGLPDGIVAIAAGGYHSLALTAGGEVFAWGENAYGQIGNGTFSTEAPFGLATPQAVTGLPTEITAIAGGAEHSMAMFHGGEVYAWGYNYYGQLGTGEPGGQTNDGVATPVPTQLPEVRAMSGGGAFAVALDQDGQVYAWGNNVTGQLGVGTYTPDYPFGTATPSLVPDLSGLAGVSAGHYHTLARDAGGAVYAWGGNTFGQLGNGSFTPDAPYGVATPAPVAGLPAPIMAASAGSFHSLALTSDGRVFAWGRNFEGQLGRGTFTTGGDLGIATAGRVSALPGNTHTIVGGGTHSLAIAGTAPFAGEWLPVAWVSLDSAHPDNLATLTASVTACDADETDVVRLTYVWKRNGATVRTTSLTTSVEDSLDLATLSGLKQGDVFTVDVIPNDGKADGAMDTATATATIPPYTLADAVLALEIAGGLRTATLPQFRRLDIAAPTNHVDTLDAVHLARKALGTDPNP